MIVSIGAYSLCDGTLAGGVAISELNLGVERTIEVTRTLAAADPQTYDRTARVTTAAFRVFRTHASAGAAEAFLAGLDAALPSSGTVTFTFTTSGSATMPNGKVIRHTSTQMGSTTITNYTIVGGQLT